MLRTTLLILVIVFLILALVTGAIGTIMVIRDRKYSRYYW